MDQPSVLPFAPWTIGQQIMGGPFNRTPVGQMQQRWTMNEPAESTVAAAKAEAAAMRSAVTPPKERKAAGGSCGILYVSAHSS